MRVLVLSHVYPQPKRPSFGLFVHRRVEHLRRHAEIEVVAPLPTFPLGTLAGRTPRRCVPRCRDDDGLRIHHPSVPSIPAVGRSIDALAWAASLVAVLRRVRRSFPFDLIDAHFGYPEGAAAALLGRWFHCPVVITLRGNELVTCCSPALRRQLAHALPRARVIAVSRELAALAGELGAPSVDVIANGVDRDRFRPGDRDTARRELGLPRERPCIVVPGAFVPLKEQERIIQALPLLRAGGHGRSLCIFVGQHGGAHDRREFLRRCAASLGVADSVRFAVDRPPDEMPAWLRSADVVASAAIREGSPNALIEALACGRPVVATAVGGVPDLVVPGRDGLLLPPAASPEAWATALADALARAWDTAAIAARAHARSWARVADEVAQVWSTAVAQSLSARRRGA